MCNITVKQAGYCKEFESVLAFQLTNGVFNFTALSNNAISFSQEEIQGIEL